MTLALADTPILDIRRRLPRASGRVWPGRDIEDIKGVVLHHTASDMEVQPTADYHISLGSPGLRYTFWVDVSGEVLWCNDLGSIVASQGGGAPPVPWVQANTNFVSVALRGDLSVKAATHLQQLAMRWLWAWMREALDIPDDMLLGHGEFKATECPGAGGRTLVQKLTEGARAVRAHLPRSVLDVQRGLLRLGYPMAPFGADGHWGPSTQRALRRATGLDALDFDSAYALGLLLHDLQSDVPGETN